VDHSPRYVRAVDAIGRIRELLDSADALRLHLDALVTEAALDAHYDRYPALRPSLAELAIAAAELDGNPLASRPDDIRRAAAAIIERHPDADADDVLLWAEAQAASAA